MQLSQAGAGLGVFASVAAGAALVRWPGNLLAEAIMDAAALLAAATVVAWLIGLFYERIRVPLQRVTLLIAGALLGAYLTISGGYFGGYIGYNYPASQERIFAQTKEIELLTASLNTTKAELASTVNKLNDAKKSMDNPHSISSPSYDLDTSVKLQFDNAGRVQAIEHHNITWDTVSVLQANEITSPVTPSRQPQQPEQPQQQSTSPFGTTIAPLQLYTQQCQQCKECVQCPSPTTYKTNTALLLVLTFPYPVRATDIKMNSFGVTLPDNKVLALTENEAIIMFHQIPQNLVLEIGVIQSKQQ